MSTKVAKILDSADGKRRVLLTERPDGKFGCVEQYWYRNTYEGKVIAEGWASLGSPPSFFETLEIAEREAKANYTWLA